MSQAPPAADMDGPTSLAGADYQQQQQAKQGDSLPTAWAQTYIAKTTEGMIDAYKIWAPTYDSDSIGAFGYRGPDACCDLLQRHTADKQAAIMDYGAGTGLVGERLHRMGYGNILGVDISPDMVDIARAKGVYADLFLDDANALDRTQHPDQKYDAAISVGSFTHNHLAGNALIELVRVIRIGGMVFLSLREDFLRDAENGFEQTLTEMVTNGSLQQVDVSERELYTPEVAKDIYFRCWAYQKLK